MLIFIDGFDHYTTADIDKKWALSSTPNIESSIVRFGGSSIRFDNNADAIVRTFNNQSTWIIGFGFRMAGLPTSTSRFLELRDAGSPQMNLYVTNSGQLRYTRGTGTQLDISGQGLLTNQWYYIELKVVLHNTAGSFEVRVNGDTWLSGSSVDTTDTSNAYANDLRLVGFSSALFYIDDLYVCDDTGSVNNDFLGDVRVETLYATGNGTTSQLLGSDADSADNYLLIDDATPDGDSTYVEASGTGLKDTYAFGNLSSPSKNIYGVQVGLTSRKTDGGTITIAPVVRSNATDYTGSGINLSDSYVSHVQIWETDPDTSSAWTGSAVNAMEAGMVIASGAV